MDIFRSKKIGETHEAHAESGMVNLPIDMFENNGALVIVAPLAGVTLSEIQLSVEDDILNISGARKKPYESVSDENSMIDECFWGDFSRSIVLPEPVKTTDISATLKNGILTVSLPLRRKRSQASDDDSVQVIRV
jgi:HSP20 family protein